MLPADETWDSTLTLLTRARSGDDEAMEALFARYLPDLQRWASGRLPGWARSVADTHDLVQDTLLQTFKKIGDFEHRGEGALRGYLRQALMNRLRDELRRVNRRPIGVELDEGLQDPQRSPLEAAMGSQALEAYENGLSRLAAHDRELIVARFEMELTFQEIATLTGKTTPDAARMAVARALVKLTEAMDRA